MARTLGVECNAY